MPLDEAIPTTQDGLTTRVAQRLPEGNCVVLGGPRVGKTKAFEDWDGEKVIRTISELGNQEGLDTPIVIDSFYELYTQAPDHGMWEDVFACDAGVCYITRPRRFDWLLTQTNLDERLTLDALEAFYVRYRRSSDTDTTETSAEFIADHHSDIDKQTIEKNIEKLFYEYPEYRHEGISLPTYTTYIPFLVCDDRIEDFVTDGFIFPEVAKEVATTLGENAVISSVIGSAKDSISSWIGKSSLVASVSLSTVSGPATAVGGTLLLTVWYYYSHRRQESQSLQNTIEEVLEPLGEEILLPHSQAVIEEKVGLPPETLEMIRVLGGEASPTQLQDLLQLDPDDIESQIQQNETELTAMDTRLSALADRVDYFVDSAVLDTDALLRDQRRVYRDRLDDIGMPPARRESVLRRLKSEPLHEDLVDEVVDSICSEEPGAKLLVVKGPQGSGKSGFLYHVTTELEAQGFDTGYYATGKDSDFVTSYLRDTAIGDAPFALVYEHTPDRSVDDFRRIFGDQLDDLVDVILVEVQDSLYPELQQAWNSGLRRNIAAHNLDERVDNTPVSNPVDLPELRRSDIEAIASAFNIGNSDIIDQIEEIGDGNPLVTFESCMLAYQNKHIEAVSNHSFLKEQIERAINHFSNISDFDALTIRQVFYSLAVCRKAVDLDTILDLAGVTDRFERGQLANFIREKMGGYIVNRKAGGYWTLRPAVYLETGFRKVWFDESPPAVGDRRRKVLLDRIAELDVDSLGSVAINLGSEWKVQIGTEDRSDEHLQRIIDASVELFEHVAAVGDRDQYRFYQYDVLHRLVSRQIPLPPVVETSKYVQISKTRSRTRMYHITTGEVTPTNDLLVAMFQPLRRWIAAHLVAETRFSKRQLTVDHREAVRELLELAADVEVRLGRDETIQPHLDQQIEDIVAHLGGLIAISFVKAASWESLADVKPWLPFLESEVRRHIPDSIKDGEVFNTIYSKAVALAPVVLEDADIVEWLEVAEDRVAKVDEAEMQYAETDPQEQLFANLYGRMIMNLHQHTEESVRDRQYEALIPVIDNRLSEMRFGVECRYTFTRRFDRYFDELPEPLSRITLDIG